jgi:hypothetical protein
MQKIVLSAISALVFAMVAQADDIGPSVVVFPGKGKLGSVSFDHLGHHERGAECALCHHTGVNEGSCSDCHGPDPAAPHIQDAFHLLCIGCHKHKGATADCEGCHAN